MALWNREVYLIILTLSEEPAACAGRRLLVAERESSAPAPTAAAAATPAVPEALPPATPTIFGVDNGVEERDVDLDMLRGL